MDKKTLTEKIAEKAMVSTEDANACMDAFLESVKEALASGETVQLNGFGTFKITERAARTGRNPRTGEAVEIAASKSPAFKASKAFKDAIS